MYRELQADPIIETLRVLRSRIAERFPGSGLSGVAEEVLEVARCSRSTLRAISRPIYPLRIGVWLFAVVIAAVLAGHSVLHDRQSGTLTFLLLAPVRRTELLLGKVLGAIGPSFAMYLVISGGATVLASTFAITEPYAVRLPPSPPFLVAGTIPPRDDTML